VSTENLVVMDIECRTRCDTIQEFNVDSKSDCDQLNLAHETKAKNASAHLVQYR